jgi:hypothetical protein
VAVVGMVVGDIPTAFGLSPWISLALGVGLLYLVLRVVGRRPEDPANLAAEARSLQPGQG